MPIPGRPQGSERTGSVAGVGHKEKPAPWRRAILARLAQSTAGLETREMLREAWERARRMGGVAGGLFFQALKRTRLRVAIALRRRLAATGAQNQAQNRPKRRFTACKGSGIIRKLAGAVGV